MFRQAIAMLLVATPLGQSATALAGADAAPGAPAVDTRIMLFNLTPAGSYQVRRNGISTDVLLAAPSGGVVYEATAAPGDRFEFLLSGIAPVDPTRPMAFTATGNSEGCVLLRWDAPSSLEYVTDYSLLWGASAGAYTDSVRIDGIDIAKGTTWVAGRCGFASGTYAFALRAHNAFDRWSALSAASATTIGNQDTQGPVPPTGVKASEPSFGCAALSWTRSSDPSVSGYRVFYGSRPRAQAAYTDSIEAQNATQASRCGFGEGKYYFAVRAYTANGLMSAYSNEVTLTARGSDTSPPVISQRSPAPGATGVALNSPVYFVVTDDKTGVDATRIAVALNGEVQTITTSSTVDGLAVQCHRAGDFPPDADVEVAVSVADRASPANVASLTYTFHTGTSVLTDTSAPSLAATSPIPGQEGVDPRPTIEVRVRDAGLGVDFASLVMEVNGDAVAFAIEGSPADAYMRYRPPSSFPSHATIDVRVIACDRASPANCAPVLAYRFSVAAANASVEGRGAIVPDGYWANEPERPLEVRNLPGRWSVRIYDLAGAAVRHHANMTEGTTWTWNFRNNDGQRVAPALYLVRVTDANGAVQRRGRFLVQSQQ